MIPTFGSAARIACSPSLSWSHPFSFFQRKDKALVYLIQIFNRRTYPRLSLSTFHLGWCGSFASANPFPLTGRVWVVQPLFSLYSALAHCAPWRKNVASKYYDTPDPSIRDSKLALDKRSSRGFTSQATKSCLCRTSKHTHFSSYFPYFPYHHAKNSNPRKSHWHPDSIHHSPPQKRKMSPPSMEHDMPPSPSMAVSFDMQSNQSHCVDSPEGFENAVDRHRGK